MKRGAEANLNGAVRLSGAGPRLWRSPAAAGAITQRRNTLTGAKMLRVLRLGFATAAVRLISAS